MPRLERCIHIPRQPGSLRVGIATTKLVVVPRSPAWVEWIPRLVPLSCSEDFDTSHLSLPGLFGPQSCVTLHNTTARGVGLPLDDTDHAGPRRRWGKPIPPPQTPPCHVIHSQDGATPSDQPAVHRFPFSARISPAVRCPEQGAPPPPALHRTFPRTLRKADEN